MSKTTITLKLEDQDGNVYETLDRTSIAPLGSKRQRALVNRWVDAVFASDDLCAHVSITYGKGA